MSDSEKAKLEIANFENFLHLGKISFDSYQSQKPPEPDVIAWRGKHPFGIEITNFHRQEEKRKESEEDRVLERAFELYRSRSGANLMLHAMWAPHYTIRKQDREKVAEMIAAAALAHTPPLGSWTTLEWRELGEPLMSIIDHISIYRMKAGIPSHWSAARGAFVPQWDAGRLQREIDRKKEKPKEYRSRYSEIWLLLVSPFGTPSSWMEMNAEVRNAQFISPFDKIFLLSSFPLEAIELRSIRP